MGLLGLKEKFEALTAEHRGCAGVIRRSAAQVIYPPPKHSPSKLACRCRAVAACGAGSAPEPVVWDACCCVSPAAAICDAVMSGRAAGEAAGGWAGAHTSARRRDPAAQTTGPPPPPSKHFRLSHHPVKSVDAVGLTDTGAVGAARGINHRAVCRKFLPTHARQRIALTLLSTRNCITRACIR